MKKIIFLILAIGGFSLSQNAVAQDETRDNLDKVSTHLLSFKTLQADFTFTLKNEAADIEDTHKGSLVIQGEKFRLSLMGMLAQCNGETMWNYLEEMNEASILDPAESDFFNPVNIFTLYKEDFQLKTLSKTGNIHLIELIPSAENDEYTKILISIDVVKKMIREVTYFGGDGNLYIIKISNLIPDLQVDDRFFIFDPAKYPGVEVYDMR